MHSNVLPREIEPSHTVYMNFIPAPVRPGYDHHFPLVTTELIIDQESKCFDCQYTLKYLRCSGGDASRQGGKDSVRVVFSFLICCEERGDRYFCADELGTAQAEPTARTETRDGV